MSSLSVSDCPAVPTPWVRKSTAQGRRRVSLRLRIIRGGEFAQQSAAACKSTESEERGTKRTNSPVESAAKRMRLTDSAEKKGEWMEEEGHDDEKKEEERNDNHDGAIDPDMQVTSSYSSSSGSRSIHEDGMEDGTLSEIGSEVYLEDEEEEEEEEEEVDVEVEDEEEDDDYIEVDKTDIITSDEGEEEEQENGLDGHSDLFSRFYQFRKLSLELDQRFEMVPFTEPSQLTNRCHGVGPASEVWSLMCHKDELHSICNENFMVDHCQSSPIPPAYRATLIDWMQEVCSAEKLHRETFHLAVDYVDRVMSMGPAKGIRVRADKYQLLGTTALFVAAKYEEIYPPKVEDIVPYTDNCVTANQVRSLELVMLKVLEWEVNVITPLQWTHLLLELLTGNPKPSSSTTSSRFSLLPQSSTSSDFFYEGEDEPIELPATTGSCTRDDFMYMAYVMDVVILHDECRKYTNRVLAAAVMHAVYDADEAIEQVTGIAFTDSTLMDALRFVEPIVFYCEEKKNPLNSLPEIDGIRADAVHTIQLLRSQVSMTKSVDQVMKDIASLRVKVEADRVAAELEETKKRSDAIRLASIENIDHSC